MFSVILGLGIGLFFSELSVYTNIICEVYLKLLEICVYPIIILCIVRGFIRYDSKSTNNVSVYVKYWLGSALIIAFLGATLGYIFCLQPLDNTSLNSYIGDVEISVSKIISDMFTDNLFSALASENILQVVMVSVLLGLAARRVRNAEVIYRIEDTLEILWVWLNGYISLIVDLLPLGVFFLVQKVVAQTSFNTAQSIVYLLMCIICGYLLLLFIVYPAMIISLIRESPWQFYKRFKNALATAFFSCSSSAAYPLVIETVQNSYSAKIDTVAGLALIMKHANCMQTPIYYIWGASLAGQEVIASRLLLACLMGILTSLGTAGVPGGGIVMIAVSYRLLGIPLEYVTLIAGIYSIIDMPGTVVNVVDDCIGIVLSLKNKNIRV